MALRLTSAPLIEPLTLTEAKLHLRVSGTDEDTLITNLISAARVQAENICRRAFITQSWTLYLDAFPLYSYFGVVPGYVPVDQLPSGWMSMRNYAVRFRGGRIDLPFPTLQAVSSIKYLDLNGTLQTLDPSLYTVDDASEPGSVTPAPNTYWPDTQNIVNAVQIAYTAGYGSAATDVPASIKAWMLMRIGALYANREEVVVDLRVASVDLPFVQNLLDPHRVWNYA